MHSTEKYDFIVIGSGFGGSVAALRLTEKGYKVLVIEKGRRVGNNRIPKTNWNLRKWIWFPPFRFFGYFRISFLKHLTVLSGTGVGGGSLVYGNVLARPKDDFYSSGKWSGLTKWKQELEPFYERAIQMMGATENPRLCASDRALADLAVQTGLGEYFFPTLAAVYFGRPEETVPDPYFNGEGPDRTGCRLCGGCMVGCRFNAKNTLDKNYLYLAEKLGATILPETEVMEVCPVGNENGADGYSVVTRSVTRRWKKQKVFQTRGVVFAAGVLGTVDLMLKLKDTTLPLISHCVGKEVFTNNESLIGVISFDKLTDFSEGVAIGSILQTDANSHVEPVRYSRSSGFWRLLMAPLTQGPTFRKRLVMMASELFHHPLQHLRVFFMPNIASHTTILLFMQHLPGALSLKRGLTGIQTVANPAQRPSTVIPQAGDLARRFASIVNGKPMVVITESLFGNPTTAHLLGGAVMGKDPSEGVIDQNNRVFGYRNMYVCDGSMISANPGVNPSLTILAMAERAMDQIS